MHQHTVSHHIRRGAGALLGLAMLLALGCGIPKEQYESDMAGLRRVIEDTNAQNASLDAALVDARNEKQMLQLEISALKAEMQSLEGEREANTQAIEKARVRIAMFRSMLEKFRKMKESGTIDIKVVNNRMIVAMKSAILFPSAKAKLSDSGMEALTEVAQVLATIDDRQFQVAGHTDNKPIRNYEFKNNWELSSARAVAVVLHLVENGMNAANLSSAGYADTQPVSSNETADGRELNRRIEIVLLPNLDELPDLSSLENMVD
ncbi:MAG: OmpA family protein [Proteobacteria bacterium]|nr:OmpA family protein [Pseudomonadota bacterium]NLN62897.1 OmpA family protein [Myxococcales bacterium]